VIRTRQRALLAAYQQGGAAFKIGLPMEACPYPQVVEYRRFWEKGFLEEQRKQKRFTRKLVRGMPGIHNR
jgi:ribosome modulation factor